MSTVFHCNNHSQKLFSEQSNYLLRKNIYLELISIIELPVFKFDVFVTNLSEYSIFGISLY